MELEAVDGKVTVLKRGDKLDAVGVLVDGQHAPLLVQSLPAKQSKCDSGIERRAATGVVCSPYVLLHAAAGDAELVPVVGHVLRLQRPDDPGRRPPEQAAVPLGPCGPTNRWRISESILKVRWTCSAGGLPSQAAQVHRRGLSGLARRERHRYVQSHRRGVSGLAPQTAQVQSTCRP